jgi:hypothetical protein
MMFLPGLSENPKGDRLRSTNARIPGADCIPERHFVAFRNVRPPWAPTLLLKLRDFGTPRWQLTDKLYVTGYL